jgi:hypothetical protein
MSADDLHERFPCPLAWCQGYTWTHGGDNADPSQWLHESAPQQLAGGVTLNRWATTLDGERWTLRTEAHAEIHEADTITELADLLAQVSVQLRSIAEASPR